MSDNFGDSSAVRESIASASDGASFRRSKIQVLDRSALIINILAQASTPLPLKRVSEQSGLHTATCHRLLEALSVHSLVKRTRTPKGYILNPQAVPRRLYDRYLVADSATLSLRKLSAQNHSTTQLVFREELDLVCALQHRSGAVTESTWQPKKLHRSAIGVHWLGHLGYGYTEQYILRLRESDPSFNVLPKSLWSLAAGTIDRGFVSQTLDDSQSSLTSISTLIRDDGGLPVAALCHTSESDQVNEELIDSVLTTAHKISLLSFSSEISSLDNSREQNTGHVTPTTP